MKIEWLPAAQRSRSHQLRYIADRNPRAALAMGDSIESALATLSAFPHSGRPGRVAGTREMVVSGSPFVIVYREQARSLVILRLLHSAQRWPSEDEDREG